MGTNEVNYVCNCLDLEQKENRYDRYNEFAMG